MWRERVRLVFYYAPGQANAAAARLAVDEDAWLVTEDSDGSIDLAITTAAARKAMSEAKMIYGYFR